ncbi:putative reverse transcriptase domain-containing protein [Tanacetum coccineum]
MSRTSIVEEELVEPAGEDSSDSSGIRDGIVRSFEDMPIDLDDVVRDFYHHMSEVSYVYGLSVRRDTVDDTQGRLRRTMRRECNGNGNGNGTGNETIEVTTVSAIKPGEIPTRETIRMDAAYALSDRANTGGENVARAYMAGNIEKNGYEGTRPFCNKSQGHYQKDCPKVKNQNRGNKARVPDARGKAYVLGGDITPYALDVSYAVELADRRTSETNTVLRGYSMRGIVYDEKIVCIPYRNEILIVQGDKSDKEKKSTLSIISCVKAQKYMEKGCQLFPDIDYDERKQRQVEGEATRRRDEGSHVDPAKNESIQGGELPNTPNRNFAAVFDAERRKAIAYASRQLKIHEKNYTTHDLELGAVVFALKMWRHYLYDTKCVVFTNHKSLQHILDQKELNMRQRKWLELLSDYNCTQLDMSTAYHPQIDGQSERTIQTLEDMLRACVMDFGKGWDRHLPLIEILLLQQLP